MIREAQPEPEPEVKESQGRAIAVEVGVFSLTAAAASETVLEEGWLEETGALLGGVEDSGKFVDSGRTASSHGGQVPQDSVVGSREMV